MSVLRTPKASGAPGLEQTEGLGLFSERREEEEEERGPTLLCLEPGFS